jgi:hypothetical protein
LGLSALGGGAWGGPPERYAALVQAHGQVQVFGLAGLLILGVGALLLPGFWKARLARPQVISYGGGLVGVGLLAQLVGQPLEPSPVRQILLALAAALPVAGFGWSASELLRLRFGQRARPASWETLLLVAGASLVGALLVRALYLAELLLTGLPASYAALHQALVVLELHGFVLAATFAIQLRLLPSLARTRPVSGPVEHVGIGVLALAIIVQLAALGLVIPDLVLVGAWLEAAAAILLCAATGLWRRGVPPTVQAPVTLLPGRTRQVVRVAWAGLLVGLVGRASGLIAADAATHAVSSVYLVPLILVVGVRMLPRVSAYPVRFPVWSGALIWCGLVGGLLRAFSSALGSPIGWQLAWLGGTLVTLAVLSFAALAWSPWGVPTGVPRTPEVANRP